MSIAYCRKTRRQFLVGAGKSLLLLPVLPSLLPNYAMAQATTTPKRMMLFWFDHNNLTTLWPQPSIATTAVGNSGSREVLLRSLGAANTLSPILADPRWESLRQNDQLTIVRGLSTATAFGPGHGNFTLAAAEDRNSEGGHPTIDFMIENSPNVYPASTPASVRRAIRIHPGQSGLFYSRVGAQLQAQPGYTDRITDFYNQVFGALTAGTTPPPASNQLKTNVLNRTHAAFMSFRNNRRISSDDRARLDQHMGFLTDLQRSYESAVPAITCNRPAAPANADYEPLVYNALYMSLLAVAFKCGLTKFGVMAFEAHDPQWIPNLGIRDMHDAMHGGQGTTIQQQAFQRWWTYFTNLIATRFLDPLSELEGNTGRSYVANMLTGMLCAGGMHGLGGDGGHSGLDSQQVLIGNMNGAIRSGRYLALPRPGNDHHMIPYNCFLITLLQLMGVPPAQYSAYAANQQGVGYYAGFPADHPHRARFYQPITELLTA